MNWELIVSAVVFGFIAAYVYKFTMDWLERTYPDRSEGQYANWGAWSATTTPEPTDPDQSTPDSETSTPA